MKKFKSFIGLMISFVILSFYFIHQNQQIHLSEAHTTHQPVAIPESYESPKVDIHVQQDQSGTWLLELDTENFRFTPHKVGAEAPSYHEGHAHLYINGEKVNRLYGKYYNLGTLDEGENKIVVSLHSNNHGVLVYKGKRFKLLRW
ncbi:hypothetical protein [Salinibacillus xinjiangensis]|uniref:Uncharacterized protein n=1 Tax=Salinibacillus xinjiangensis TaxID=1229268 RepID=A0A6G1X4W9_9BACI|nr:hypothetical protein [Salinibacillus xinjiangensis]MRG85946.1 hypothetical protein [Salinibacillus xinjiangensis]